MNINLGFPDRRKRHEDDPSGHSTAAGEKRSKACARLSRNAWRLVAPNGVPVRLTHREWLLLQVLWKHKGTPVSREAIAKALGHDDMYIGNSLEALVSRLRNKMRGGCPGWEPLRAVVNRGYAVFPYAPAEDD